jgi:hypothetical protein
MIGSRKIVLNYSTPNYEKIKCQILPSCIPTEQRNALMQGLTSKTEDH